MENDVVIVDYDCMTSLGCSIDETWANLILNKSGIRKITRYDPVSNALKGVPAIEFAGEIPLTYDEIAGGSGNYERFPEPSFHGVKKLCRRLFAKLNFDISDHDPQRAGILGATALTSQISQSHVEQSKKPCVNFILNQCHNVPLSIVSKEFGINGPSFSISGACASGNHAIFMAYYMLKTGLLDFAIVAGFEFPVLPICVGGFSWLRSLYSNDRPSDRAYNDPSSASRPFSFDRQGFVLAEGIGAILISRADYAKKNRWQTKANISGGYMNSDGEDMVKMNVDNITLCMQMALKNSNRSIDDIDCVNAHGTSTKVGDLSELSALYRVFGERLHRMPIVANKSQIGHSLGASSVLEMIIATESMDRNILTPTLNHIHDSELPKAFFPEKAIEYKHDSVLLNSFGFGGTNVSLVIETIK